MSDIDQSLLALTRANVPSEPDVAACWDLLVQGIELGWIDFSDFSELKEYLHERRDWGVQELLFANLGDSVRVTFLESWYSCATQWFVNAMEIVVSCKKLAALKTLLEIAQESAPSDPDTSQCWGFVVKGIEVGWLTVLELSKLKHQLDGFNDYGVEDLMFSNREDSTIKVEFLDDSWICSAELFRSALGRLIAAIAA